MMNATKSHNKAFLKKLTPYVFLTPALIVFLIFLIIPIIFSFYISLNSWDLIGEHSFNGFANYKSLLGNERFIRALTNTVTYALSVPIKVILALGVAVLLNNKIKGLAFYRTAFFIPIVLSLVVVGMVWQWLFNINSGFINLLLTQLNFEPQKWLIRPGYSMLLIVIVSIWAGLGNNIILFLAGLQGIPKSLYEAASIDGGNAWQKFRHITVPSLRHVTLFVTITSFIGAFKVFDLAYVLTGGGPAGSTTTIVQFIYEEAFEKHFLGSASAGAYIFFIILFTITLLQMKVFDEKE